MNKCGHARHLKELFCEMVTMYLPRMVEFGSIWQILVVLQYCISHYSIVCNMYQILLHVMSRVHPTTSAVRYMGMVETRWCVRPRPFAFVRFVEDDDATEERMIARWEIRNPGVCFCTGTCMRANHFFTLGGLFRVFWVVLNCADSVETIFLLLVRFWPL